MNILSNRCIILALSSLSLLACSSSDSSPAAQSDTDASTQSDTSVADSSTSDSSPADASEDSTTANDSSASDSATASDSSPTDGGYDVYTPPTGKKLVATITTSMGNIVVELNSSAAPITTTNFKNYADAKFFDGLIFHRVIKGFMIQGGGFLPGMKERKAIFPPIIDEAKTSGLSNTAGTIAMARTDDPNSATSQFFINTVDNVFLDPSTKNPDGYAVFGAVTQGMDVVSAIESVATKTIGINENVPVTPVLINSVVVEEK
jgi:cyclophilin family peptidyl-prolyl cis-trans isomerase